MFTGIIQALGTIKKLDNRGNDIRLTVASPTLDMSDVALGDSIATNGVCLTVTDMGPDYYCADVSAETIKLTGFAHYSAGSTVNLEKAMRPSDRLGGHIVSGHVDAVATVESIQDNGNSIEYWISMPNEIARYIAEKGSVTIDGTSLTVNSLNESSFRLTIVPHTRAETIIVNYQVGTKVNVEVDVMARYLERLLSAKDTTTPQSSGVTEALLMQSGFIKN